MKKNQSGVSLIALVITIIVVIILAAVAFGSSTDTITNANFSTFTNNLGEVRTAFQTVATTVKGQEAQNQITRTDAQVFNFVAKGSTLEDDATARQNQWLPRSVANAMDCTQLNETAMKDVLDMALPTIKVNTDAGTGRKVSYFVTREGIIFVWPPYEYENEFYVTDTIKVLSGDNATSIKADNADDTAVMYGEDFTFRVGGVDVTATLVADTDTGLAAAQAKVSPDNATPAADGSSTVSGLATVFYTDAANAVSPVGLESNMIYNAAKDNGEGKMAGGLEVRS